MYTSLVSVPLWSACLIWTQPEGRPRPAVLSNADEKNSSTSPFPFSQSGLHLRVPKHVTHFSVAVVKHHDQKQLKEEFILAHGSRELDVHKGQHGSGWLEEEAGWSHFISMLRNRESEN